MRHCERLGARSPASYIFVSRHECKCGRECREGLFATILPQAKTGFNPWRAIVCRQAEIEELTG
jgi:hypothetical protein